MKLTKLEEDILSDLHSDSHELWEWYAFVRTVYPELSEEKIIQHGRRLLDLWLQRGWLKASKSRNDRTTLSGAAFLAAVDNLGIQAADPAVGTILLNLTERAEEDIKWIRPKSH